MTTLEPAGSRHVDLRLAVVAELRRRILEGELGPGTPLLEEQVAEELGVSRNPVREALVALAAAGLVEMTPRRSARVVTLDERWVRQVFEVRGELEGLAANLAAQRATPEDVARLRAIVAEGNQLVEAGGKPAELAMLNSRFHRAVIELAGNRFLSEVLTGVDGMMQLIFSRNMPPRRRGSWAEHADLVDALAAGDPDAAEWVATAHVAAAKLTADAILRGLAVPGR